MHAQTPALAPSHRLLPAHHILSPRQSSSLTSISLASNNLGDEGVLALVHSGLFRGSLQSCDLKSNLVGFKGVKALLDGGAFDHALTDVDLRTNPLTAPGRQKLREYVGHRQGFVLRV